jgi:hypothetical protein
MKARVTKSDGTVVEIEGTPEEIARATETASLVRVPEPGHRASDLTHGGHSIRAIDKPS